MDAPVPFLRFRVPGIRPGLPTAVRITVGGALAGLGGLLGLAVAPGAGTLLLATAGTAVAGVGACGTGLRLLRRWSRLNVAGRVAAVVGVPLGVAFGVTAASLTSWLLTLRPLPWLETAVGVVLLLLAVLVVVVGAGVLALLSEPGDGAGGASGGG